ncbi:MAG: carboxymuconolactone decarboxylase family protein, partial [Tateyamaria sp.]|nr:carboxymuconolactone decarboxylase family protein [Tateyamaria sp.]
SRNELCEALEMIGYMGGGPSIAFAAKALEAFDEFSKA